ncbi:MAG: DNA cytosine methyltransferase [Defluviitaleaceae bacterium]|nr:DNA cytosine methyltransferase [Defluviitaleaceae bacterium]
MKTTFTAIDLFAGIGGFRMAIERCGGQTIAFSEINSDAISAYIENYNEESSANLGDITKLDDLPQHDLLTAGVPCQSWSIAGRNLGFDDDRGQLWNDALFLLKKSRPKVFIFENVKGLADPRNKDALDYIMNRIKEAGYHADYYVLDSFDYGVPQSRVRIYIIGFLDACFHDAFFLPRKVDSHVKLIDILDDEVIFAPSSSKTEQNTKIYPFPSTGVTSLSSNNNGFNDYFLFNDLRNGHTTIHSWDMIDTTDRQKEICLLLLRNRRKKDFGPLDGNPLSLVQFQQLDYTITENELDELVSIDILKKEKYSYAIIRDPDGSLTPAEMIILSKEKKGIITPDEIVCDREIKINKVNITETLNSLKSKGIVDCCEERYEFRYTKISTGLFGINRIFLPSSNIFPTLVASDSNDFLTPVHITANNVMEYRKDFMEHVLNKKAYRKISKTEALRIQGFPEDFQLPESRSRWMKLVGNSVAVPVIEKLITAIKATDVFNLDYAIEPYMHKDSLAAPSHYYGQMSLFEA